MSPWLELMQNPLSRFLPNDIVSDILVRLPVKSIVRFKCTCKLWSTLFGNRKFIEMHLKQAIANNNDCLLLRYMTDGCRENPSWQSFEDFGDIDDLEEINDFGQIDVAVQSTTQAFSMGSITEKLIDTDTLCGKREIFSFWSKETFVEFEELEVPIRSGTNYYSIVESSNGLICLTESNFSNTYHSLNTFLWNPSTREFRTLPGYFSKRFPSSLMVVGLGFVYHPITNDYKVIRIIYFFYDETYEVEVYSKNTDDWRIVSADIQGYYFHEHLSQASINGALHWLVSTSLYRIPSEQEVILSFDVGEEKFNKLMLPDFGYPDDMFPVHKHLSVFEDSLALFIHKPFQDNNSFDIWVMEEYREVLSWTKLYSIFQEEELMLPLYFVGNGVVIMKKMSDGELKLGDSNFKKIKSLQVCNWPRVVKYIESMVSPTGGSQISAHLNQYGSACDPCYSWNKSA